MGGLIKLCLPFACLLLISCACDKDANTKILKANKQIEVYKSYADDQQQIIFFLNPGDECTLGKKKVAKLYSYYEVTCIGKGSGWVALGDGFEIIERAKK